MRKKSMNMFSINLSNNKLTRRLKKMTDRLRSRGKKKDKLQVAKSDKDEILFV